LKSKTILETEKDGQANLADVCGKRLSLSSGMCSLFECLIPLFVVMLEPSQWDLSRGRMCVHNGVMVRLWWFFFLLLSLFSLLFLEFMLVSQSWKVSCHFVFILNLIIFLLIAIYFGFFIFFFNFIPLNLVSLNFYIIFDPHSFDCNLFCFGFFS